MVGIFQIQIKSLAETSGHALAAMGFAMGLQRLAQRSEVQIYDKASQVAGILSVVIAGMDCLLPSILHLTGQR